MATQPPSQKRLRVVNGVVGLLHLFQGIVVLLLSSPVTFPITGSYLSFDTASASLEPATKVLFELSLPILIASVFFVCAAVHLIIATVYYKRYTYQLSKRYSVARWAEYAVSAGGMIVAIGLLVGITDIMSLVMMFVFVSIMNLLGLVMEVHNQTTRRPNWLSYIVACLAAVVPWVVISFSLWPCGLNVNCAPEFQYWTFVAIFALFNCFAVNMVLVIKQYGPWKDYMFGELVYVALSLVSKSVLAWLVFVSLLAVN